jgi:hypothetical protein
MVSPIMKSSAMILGKINKDIDCEMGSFCILHNLELQNKIVSTTDFQREVLEMGKIEEKLRTSMMNMFSLIEEYKVFPVAEEIIRGLFWGEKLTKILEEKGGIENSYSTYCNSCTQEINNINDLYLNMIFIQRHFYLLNTASNIVKLHKAMESEQEMLSKFEENLTNIEKATTELKEKIRNFFIKFGFELQMRYFREEPQIELSLKNECNGYETVEEFFA